MVTKHIVVLPYDDQWKQDFIKIKDELTSLMLCKNTVTSKKKEQNSIPMI